MRTLVDQCSYSDYQAFKEKSATISTNTSSTAEDGLFWDENIQEDEQDGIFEYGADQAKRYYPCILLKTTTIDIIKTVKDNFDDLFLVYKNSIFNTTLKANQYIPLKAKGEIIFLKKNSTFTPALMITDDELIALGSLPTDVRLSKIEGYNNATNIINETQIFNFSSSPWLSASDRKTYTTVYPRFYIKSKNFISDSQENKILSGSTQLEENEDYYILYDYDRSQWLITIKPLVFLKQNYSSSTYTLKYTLSTAADAIFLDAQEVMKENSTPKVSYEITPLAKDVDLIKYAYNRIGQLAHINDHELKFKNVMGYISEVNLNLDKPWEDTYVVKNYKTKFEDLFSTIVAQTEAMKKNSQVIGLATNLIDTNGNLRSDLLLDALGRVDLSKIMERYTFSAAGIRAIEDKAALANSVAYKIINGEIGLAFPKSSTIDNVILNNEVGLKIEGLTLSDDSHTYHTSFRVTNDNLGFFKTDGTNEVAMLYFNADSGDMALKGTIFAKNGWFGGERGWIISDGTNKITPTGSTTAFTSIDTLKNNTTKNISDLGGLFYSANGKVLIAAGSDSKEPFMGFYKSKDGKNPVFIFDGKDVYLNGTIFTSAGSIGGWTLAANRLTSGSSTNTVALDSGTSGVDYAIWAGNAAGANAPFSVTRAGAIKSTSGTIGGWTIDSDSIYTGTTKTDTSSIRLSSADFSRSINNVSRNNLRLAFGTKFGVASDGTLYATGATISGAITATSGTFTGTINANNGKIGSTATNQITLGDGTISQGKASLTDANNGFYISKDGIALGKSNIFKVTSAGVVTANSITIGSDNDTLTYTSSGGLVVKGSVTATKGTIGGWTIGSYQLNSGSSTTYVALNSGAKDSTNNPNGDYAIWAGNATPSSAPFSVTKKGQLSATGATISGEITATKLTLNGATIPYDKLTDTPTIPDVSLFIKQDGTIGKTPGANSTGFIVSSAGLLTAGNAVIYGTIYASAGTIGGWTISNGVLYNHATDIQQSTAGIVPTPSDNTYPVLWIGGKRFLSYTTNGNTASEVAPFRVTKVGTLYSSNAVITGNITANNLYLSDGSGGTTDVAGTLSRLLLQADSAEDDATEEVNQKTIIITGYGSNYLKLLRSDGKKKTINFKTAADVKDAHDSGYNEGYSKGQNSVSVNSVTLGSKVTGAQYNCTCNLSNGTSKASTINVSSAYSDAREGYTRGDFYATSDTFYVQNGPSSYTRYTGTLYKKR